ncbi:hypothetical protein C2W59_01565 [Bacillus pumilus]|uniref:Cyclic lactone autoinducer peptide n=1 Tax=Bacillus pumilus TaxID=1408 RepID=A0AB34QUH5_BACPU|nr:hypothetical protein B4127_0483 [Bacillus pumilus]RAP12396.1 hypothetical protein C2W58_03296 [Bacillus pumilus]RAP17986.1 hypothetical protein C2W59_01565 [Bacillus pumilus]
MKFLLLIISNLIENARCFWLNSLFKDVEKPEEGSLLT